MLPSLEGRDLPGGGYYRHYDEYSDKHDTPENRDLLAARMVAAVTSGLRRVTPGAALELVTAIDGWLDKQDGNDVLDWLADEGIVPRYDDWVEGQQ